MINEIILAGVTFFHPQPQRDSLGIETINGKIYVLHKVEEKETLYAISRRYGASVEAVQQSNPGLTSTLEVGKILKVPYTKPVQSPTSKPKNAITHKVAAKETMFSIAKQYGISVDELKEWNNLKDNTLSIGQELIVKKPSSATTFVQKTTKPTDPAPSGTKGTHTVAAGETLFSISRQHNVSVQQLKSWNNLEGNDLSTGQVLILNAPEHKEPASSEQPVVEARKPVSESPVKTESTSPPVNTNSQSTTPASNTPVSAQKTETAIPSKTQTIRISESVRNSDEVMESGLAELIEGTEGNRKYLALHRTAPVGTILKVRNEMNNREVFVRVMGKLPDSSLNDKVVIKISRSAYDRLGAIDPKFRVEVTYYK
jgi:LysM repeat protein